MISEAILKSNLNGTNSAYNAAILEQSRGLSPEQAKLTLEDRMRSFAVGITLTIVTAAAAAVVVAQQPTTQTAPPEMKTYTSAADVQALIAQSKNARLLAAAPYSVNMEYRPTVGPAAVHEREAEIFYVIEGTGTLVTGGKLVNETRTNPTNLSGTGVEGGLSRTVSKGDFILVPEGTPHWFSAIGGNGALIDMSIHLPRPVPSFADLEKLVPVSK